MNKVTKWQNNFESMKTDTRSEFWYTEGCRLACFDLLKGTSL